MYFSFPVYLNNLPKKRFQERKKKKLPKKGEILRNRPKRRFLIGFSLSLFEFLRLVQQ